MTKKSREYRRSCRERVGRYRWTIYTPYEAWARDLKGSMYPVKIYVKEWENGADVWENKVKKKSNGI